MPRVGIPWRLFGTPRLPINGCATTRFYIPFWLEIGVKMREKWEKNVWIKTRIREGKIEKKRGREMESMRYLSKNLDCSCVEHKIWLECDLILWKRISRVVIVEVIKANKQWCNPLLWRTVGSTLAKKAAAPWWVGKGPDQSCVYHHWRASILEPHRDLKITSF